MGFSLNHCKLLGLIDHGMDEDWGVTLTVSALSIVIIYALQYPVGDVVLYPKALDSIPDVYRQ